MRVKRVARASYALTLWAFLQRAEFEMFEALMREDERIDGAHLVTLGAIVGMKPIIARANALRVRVTAGPVTPSTLEDLSRHADELWAQHEKAMSKRPVS